MEIITYNNYAVTPIHADNSGMRVTFSYSKGRRSHERIIIAQVKYITNGIEYEYFLHNTGFDCNYKKEWKTLSGAVRYFENKFGKILLQ